MLNKEFSHEMISKVFQGILVTGFSVEFPWARDRFSPFRTPRVLLRSKFVTNSVLGRCLRGGSGKDVFVDCDWSDFRRHEVGNESA